MLLVDTNVLIDVLEDDPSWADWSIRQLRAQAQVHELAINPVIYAELSLLFDSVQATDKAIGDMGIVLAELPRPALFLAGRAHVKYRQRGRMKTTCSPIFSSVHMPPSAAAASSRVTIAGTRTISRLSP